MEGNSIILGGVNEYDGANVTQDQNYVGINTAAPLNNFSVSPFQAVAGGSYVAISAGSGTMTAAVSSFTASQVGSEVIINQAGTYSTGTISQSAYTLSGTGTAWTSAMVGATFTSGSVTETIVSVTSPTSATVNASNSIATSSSYSMSIAAYKGYITGFTNSVTVTVSPISPYAIYSNLVTINYAGLQVTSAGQVGIGTPIVGSGQQLSVSGTNGSGYVAEIQNLSTATSAGTPGSSADGLIIDLGTAAASRTTGNYFVAFSSGGSLGSPGTVAGKIQGGASAVAYTTTAADYSEYFKANSNDLPQPGELVMQDVNNNQTVVRSDGLSTSVAIVGVVSSNPGFIGNGPLCNADDKNCDSDYAKYNVVVALSGQVPVDVNDSNGSINVGDPITMSSIPGQGAKATHSGYIIGYAESALSSGSGQIQVLIRPQYYTADPLTPAQHIQGSGLAISGDAAIDGTLTISGNLNASGPVAISSTLTVTGDATFSGTLTVQNISVQNITINGHIITAGNTPTATVDTAAGTADPSNNIAAPTVTIDGNDTAGTITITTGANTTTGTLANITFNTPYGKAPVVIVSPKDSLSAAVSPYADSNGSLNGFNVGIVNASQTTKTYKFNYWVSQ